MKTIVIAALALLLPVASGANWALDFDGLNDYIIVPSFAQDYTSLTVEAWVLARDSGFYGEIVGVHTGSSDLVHYQLEGGVGYLLFDPTVHPCRIDAGCPLVPDQWHHVAAVYSPPGVWIYLDGEPVGHGECTLGPFSFSGVEMLIGKEVPESNPHQYWDGLIDELRVWSTARTQTQIITSMFSPLTGSEEGLHGYWPLDEASGQVAHDLTENAQDARLGSTTGPDESDPAWVFVDSPVPVRSVSWGVLKTLFAPDAR